MSGKLFPAWHRLSTRIVGVLAGFLFVAMLAIGGTLLLSWQLEGSAAAINVAGSLRMNSYRIGMQMATDGANLSTPAAAQVRSQLAHVDAILTQLGKGDPRRPVFLPPSAEIRAEFNKVAIAWRRNVAPQVQALLQTRAPDSPERLRALRVEIDAFVREADQLVNMIERDSEQRTFWLRSSQLMLLALALIGTVSVIYLFFNMIVAPVERLQAGMERMRERDFEVRLPVEGKDEFSQLAHGFNQMADRLQGLYGGLKQLVSNKTAALEEQNRELALLYDSAAYVQQQQSAEALCDGFLQRLIDYFKADGGSVRVLDPARGNLHMLVHRGLSEEMADSEHCIKVGECLCGEAVQKKVSVVHDMRSMARRDQLRCHREGYATVSVFHIHAQGQHLGFFNLHFRTPATFNAAQRALLDTLGQLLGTAIENQRLAAREREMAVSEERNLVAQGLHDSIAQGLNFLNLQVQMLEQSVRGGKAEEVEAIVPALRAGVAESYQDVRELLNNFRTRLPDGNVAASLKETVEKFERQSGIAVHLEADTDGAPFPREYQLQMLFIAQEALSNIRKHAQASKVTVRLHDRQDFMLSIEDDGVGFEPAALQAKGDGHIGLHIMRERAQRIEAQLRVESRPGGGTRVELRVPRAVRRAA